MTKNFQALDLNSFNKISATGLRRVLLASAGAALLVLAGAGVSPVSATPLGGSVANGTATIVATDAKTTTITQSTDRAVIDWSSFDVASTETVTFSVPNSNSATLNRISGSAYANRNGSSLIAGTVRSNGVLYFTNPNGLVFDATSKVYSNGFSAYSGTVDSTEFMTNGNFKRVSDSYASTSGIQFNGIGAMVYGMDSDRESTAKFGLYGPQVSVAGKISTGGVAEIVAFNGGISLTRSPVYGAVISANSSTLNAAGNIALNGKVSVGTLSLISTASNSLSTGQIGTITNTVDIVANSLTVNSTGQGSVTLIGTHIANLGDVSLNGQFGAKKFTLETATDLTITGSITIAGALSLKTTGTDSSHSIRFDTSVNKKARVLLTQAINRSYISIPVVGVALNLESAGGIIIDQQITAIGKTVMLAKDNIEINKAIGISLPANGLATSATDPNTITSSAGSIISTASIDSVGALTIKAATGITLSTTRSNNSLTIINNCLGTDTSLCGYQNGDIVLNGALGKSSLTDGIANNFAATVTNYSGNVFVNDSILTRGNIGLAAYNGSVVQEDYDPEKNYRIQSDNGTVTLLSVRSNNAVGVKVNRVIANSDYTIPLTPTTLTVVTKNGIMITSDSDIEIGANAAGVASLSTDYGKIALTSLNGGSVSIGDRVNIISTSVLRFENDRAFLGFSGSL